MVDDYLEDYHHAAKTLIKVHGARLGEPAETANVPPPQH